MNAWLRSVLLLPLLLSGAALAQPVPALLAEIAYEEAAEISPESLAPRFAEQVASLHGRFCREVTALTRDQDLEAQARCEAAQYRLLGRFCTADGRLRGRGRPASCLAALRQDLALHLDLLRLDMTVPQRLAHAH